MSTTPRNEHGQEIGFPLGDWQPPSAPPRTPMDGRWCRLEPLDVDRHGDELFAAFTSPRQDADWTYMAYGPFDTVEEYRAWLRAACLGDDPLFFAIVDAASRRAVGVASYLRIAPQAGVLETGHIHYAPPLQRTPAATEAMYLMMRRVFAELGYRRYEWKCDALNLRSRRAAERLGFTFEGVFRQATHYKGRNRDTAWYSVLDSEWPVLERAFEQWLEPGNLGDGSRQLRSLASLRDGARQSAQSPG